MSDTSADMQCFAGRAEAGKNAGIFGFGGRAGQGRANEQGRAGQSRQGRAGQTS